MVQEGSSVFYIALQKKPEDSLPPLTQQQYQQLPQPSPQNILFANEGKVFMVSKPVEAPDINSKSDTGPGTYDADMD